MVDVENLLMIEWILYNDEYKSVYNIDIYSCTILKEIKFSKR